MEEGGGWRKQGLPTGMAYWLHVGDEPPLKFMMNSTPAVYPPPDPGEPRQMLELKFGGKSNVGLAWPDELGEGGERGACCGLIS